jgi:hypothetical protein
MSIILTTRRVQYAHPLRRAYAAAKRILAFVGLVAVCLAIGYVASQHQN